ncbi:L-rhamnose mutarotase [Saccharopolyspora sp. NPDC000359]|uniref:L-rhamnose mutarotase n=1 Tax=Saccharopolyspora sp. NPDC000359 TaxID=3154251 RepID=UPI003324C320
MQRITPHARLKAEYEQIHAVIPAEVDVVRVADLHGSRICRDGLDLFHGAEVALRDQSANVAGQAWTSERENRSGARTGPRQAQELP